jgi:hypothetical protein
MARTVVVWGYEIDIAHHVFRAKSLDELKQKTGLFQSLSKCERDLAYQELWEYITGQK